MRAAFMGTKRTILTGIRQQGAKDQITGPMNWQILSSISWIQCLQYKEPQFNTGLR